ncbi:MAG TPA: hypothetical protein VHM30_13065 [Gemmatimonadaceae bacterium]|nr:hypothetical protein [Gemmatimonadaceae bacterium]
MRLRRRRTLVVVAIATLATGACILSSTTRPFAGDTNSAPGTVVSTPVRAHLLDGSVVVFPQGVTFGTDRAIFGVGQRFNATLRDTAMVRRVPLDSVLGFEVYDRRVNPARTLLYSTVTTAASVVGAAALLVVIFGSCPTIYADSAGVETLQAESFSYSIAPLLAKRDLDRLTAQADANGVVRLVVKNEALETHYLDQLELVEVRHGANEIALPAPRSAPIAVSELVAPASIHDGAGRDVAAVLARSDDAVFATDPAFLDRAIEGGPLEDHLDIVLPKRAGRDTLALVLRARASLLTSAVLYDYMLARPGPAAIDWLGHDLGRITSVAQLARWYAGNFGMRVEVRDGDEWRQVARLMDFGPAAWREVGVAVPALGDDSVRVRISFAADEFRIDRVAAAWGVRQLEPRSVPLARVVDREGVSHADAARMLARVDDRQLVTQPGERFTAEFDAGVAPRGTRTYMLAAHGYYVEWIRPSWFRESEKPAAFTPSGAPMREVLRSWRAAKDTLEQRFFVRRVPVV